MRAKRICANTFPDTDKREIGLYSYCTQTAILCSLSAVVGERYGEILIRPSA